MSLSEVAVTLAILGVLILGMSSTMVSGVQTLVSAKQRAAAVQAANAVMERARAVARNDWTQLGLVPADINPATDSNITAGTCNGQAANMFSGEPIVPAGVGGSNPLYPHLQTATIGETTVTVKVYVTGVSAITCSVANPTYKRVTVLAEWLRAGGGVSNQVRLASYVFNSSGTPIPNQPCSPNCSTTTSVNFTGTASYTAGEIGSSQTQLNGTPPSATKLYLPQSLGDGRTIGRPIVYKGSAISASSSVDGSTTTPENKAASLADNDDTTAQGQGYPAPNCENGTWTSTPGGMIDGNLVQTGQSCSSIKYADLLPYTSTITTMSGAQMDSTVPGNGLIPDFEVREFSTTESTISTSTVDATGTGSPIEQTLETSTATVQLPSIAILTFSVLGVEATNGVVEVVGNTYSASSQAGMNALDPSVSGQVTFGIFDPLDTLSGCTARVGSYCRITVDPTVSGFTGYEASFNVSLKVTVVGRLVMTTSVSIPAPKKDVQRTGVDVTFGKATYQLPVISSTLDVQSPVATTIATVSATTDLGRLQAQCSWT